MALNQENLRTISTGFKALFGKTFNETARLAEKIATVVPSNNLQETYPWLGEIPRMKEWVGDRTVKELKDYKYTLANKKFEATVGVPTEYIEYDNAGIFAPAIKQMAQEAKQYSDELLSDLVTNGGTNLCYDGKAFFAEDHTVGSDTYANIADLTLTPGNLLATEAFMRSIKTDSGGYMKVMPNMLMVGPGQLGNAIDCIDLADDGKNPTYKRYSYIINPALEGKKWTLLDTSKAICPFILQLAKDGVFAEDSGEKFMKGRVLYGAESFMNAGYSLWQLAFFSEGGV
ncbi:MAG: Mu-like prophage major head subunit gpT family protein [Geovibrio sp.]|nr:Mu-like prophage major head subunit gpT family protein [Geovibrio sp.]